jgi:hypothetical protein
MYDVPNWRKIIALGVLFIVTIWLATWLFSYLTTGKILVETPSQTSNVSVRRLSYSPQDDIKSATHRLSIRLKPGKYIISAGDHATGISKTITVQARRFDKYVLKQVAQTGVVEPVLAQDATSLTADDNQLLYVINGVLQKVDANGSVTQLSPLLIKDARWASPSMGVIQDGNNQLYTVLSGVISPLDTGVKISGDAFSDFSLSKSGRLAFTNGKDIYAGQLGQRFKKIYRSHDDKAKVTAQGDIVAIIEALKESIGGEVDEKQIVTIDSAGKKNSRPVKDIVRAEWSPNAKYLYVATEAGDYIYGRSLASSQSFDSQTLGATAWINDEQLAYSKGRALLVYQIGSHESRQLGQTDGDISLITLSADGSYIYMVSRAATNPEPLISRFGLRGQATVKNIQALRAFLPEEVGACQLDYVNFKRPFITIKYPDGLVLPENCAKSAEGQLKYYDLNPADFGFVTSPIPSNGD